MAKTAADLLKNELWRMADPRKAAVSQNILKPDQGKCAEGDKFLGITVPKIRAAVKKHWREITVAQSAELLRSEYHEERMAALLILAEKFETGDELFAQEYF